MMDWDNGWGFGSWLAMSLMMVVFWGGLIALLVLLVRGSFGSGQRPTDTTSSERDPEQVLAERYARGEIDEDEFARRSEVLRTAPKRSS